jgi:hypothetical protein
MPASGELEAGCNRPALSRYWSERAGPDARVVAVWEASNSPLAGLGIVGESQEKKFEPGQPQGSRLRFWAYLDIGLSERGQMRVWWLCGRDGTLQVQWNRSARGS